MEERKEISLPELEKAKQVIIDFYNQDFSKVNGDDRPCICCSNMIKPLHPDSMRFPQSGMWKDGIVDRISAGYGSSHDTEMFIISICDDCIERLRKENKIQYGGNYMNLF